jgi:hypothetical protein
MSGTKFVYPSEVFAAIAEAKRRNPSDPFGDDAFHINYGSVRAGNNNVRYMTFSILKKVARDKWEYIPLNLKFANLNTTANIYPPGHAKKKYVGARLQFTKGSAVFSRKPGGRVIEERYGDAKLAIYQAYERKITKLLAEKKIFHNKTSISSTVQTERIVDTNSGKKEKLQEGSEIIRLEIPFNKTGEGALQTISTTEPPKYKIFDISRTELNPKTGDAPFKLNTFMEVPETGGEPVEASIVYGNIHKFVTYGSAVSGIDSMDSISLSQQGISLPSKATLLYVKRSHGRAPVPNDTFGDDELKDMVGAETKIEPDVDEELDAIETQPEITRQTLEGEFGDDFDSEF